MFVVAGVSALFPCSDHPHALWLLLGVLFALATVPVRKPARFKQRELSVLRNISSMVNRAVDLTAVVGSALDDVMGLLGMEAGTFRIVSNDDNMSPTAVYRGFSKDTVSALEIDQEQGGPVRQQLADNRAVVLDGSPNPSCSERIAEALRSEGLRFFALYPVRSGNRLLGTLGLASRKPKTLGDVEEDLILTLTEILGVAIVNVHLQGTGRQALRRPDRTPGSQQDHLPEL